jgi:hypothetical protein
MAAMGQMYFFCDNILTRYRLWERPEDLLWVETLVLAVGCFWAFYFDHVAIVAHPSLSKMADEHRSISALVAGYPRSGSL